MNIDELIVEQSNFNSFFNYSKPFIIWLMAEHNFTKQQATLIAMLNRIEDGVEHIEGHICDDELHTEDPEKEDWQK